MPDTTFTISHPMWRDLSRGRVDAAVREYRSDAQTALNEIVGGLAKLYETTGRTDFLEDTVAGLKDHAAQIEAQMYADLEAAGIEPDAELETADIDALLETVRGRRRAA